MSWRRRHAPWFVRLVEGCHAHQQVRIALHGAQEDRPGLRLVGGTDVHPRPSRLRVVTDPDWTPPEAA